MYTDDERGRVKSVRGLVRLGGDDIRVVSLKAKFTRDNRMKKNNNKLDRRLRLSPTTSYNVRRNLRYYM